jgi:membrane complex biogenesis BtpA family protein
MILRKNTKTIIGAVHLPPLLTCRDPKVLEQALVNATFDTVAFLDGGVDAIVFENNYDYPHSEFISADAVNIMLEIGNAIKAKSTVPVGVSVLWNDYRSALLIAKKLGLDFIRVPAFVDTVETNYGVMRARAEEVVEYRKEIEAEAVMIFADIHVKHSKLISLHSLTESAKLAIEKCADALIITGKWTGESPDITDLLETRHAVDDFPILIGSGFSDKNAAALLEIADGAIVSTSLKDGTEKSDEVNVKGYGQRILKDKVVKLLNVVRSINTHR